MNAHGNWTRWEVFSFCLLLAVACSAGNFPLKTSARNPHLLVDQNDAPFLMQGDAAWGLMVMLDKAETEQYLENRRAKGFNTLLVMLMAKHVWINDRASVNHYGQEPFTTCDDFTTPNPAYFEHVDWVIDRAAQKGMQLVLAPCYVGYYSNGLEGWNTVLLANGTNACRTFGRYVGQRYKDKPNIIWLNYGDNSDAMYLPCVRQIALGIRDCDTNHLHSAKMFPQESARQFLSGESWFNLNTTYAYGDEWIWTRKVYDMSLQDYNAIPVMPSFLVESHYEGENTEEIPGGVPPHWVRRQAYWSVLSGSTGQIMGEHHIWPFLEGWQTALDSESSAGEMYVRKLFETRPWHRMVPDQNHSVVTSGYGTFTSDNYLTAMRATNGSTIIAYLPAGRTIGVNLRQISGSLARAWWYNPRTGNATDLGTFNTLGTNSFTPADTNDWVLVVDDNSAGYAAPGAGPSPLEILTGSVPDGRAGVPYAIELLARGGIPPYLWSVASNSTTSPGLSLSSNGCLAGIPASDGKFTLMVQVLDSNQCASTQRLTMTFAVRDDSPPSAPAGLTAYAASSHQVDLRWQTATDNVGTAVYWIERRGGTNISFVEIGAAPGQFFRDSEVNGGTSYQYRIRASDTTGNLGAYSETNALTTPLVPATGAGLVASYAFDENSGAQTYDSADHGNTGLLLGAAWTDAGKFGRALTFNGTNSLVLISNAPSLNICTGMTLEAWVYPTASQTGWRTIVQREADAYLLHAGNSSYALRPTGGGTFNGAVAWTNTGTTLPLNSWTHLAATYDTSTLRIYVNGTNLASKAVTGNIQTNSNPLRIGGNLPYGEYFLGRIDEVRVYSRALNQAEIQLDMTTPVACAPTNTPPIISSIADITVDENSSTTVLTFTVTDAESPADALSFCAHSSNPTLLPESGVVFGGLGTNRTVTLTPAPGQHGVADIMVTVSDDRFNISTYFKMTVKARCAGPSAAVIASVNFIDAHRLHLAGAGEAHATYTIQTSTNLVQWTDLDEVTADETGAFEFEDTSTQDHARFYRAVQP